MRLLHTGDWHLGRKIRHESRQPEFERVLGEVTRIARDEQIDVVVIAGDTFDSLSPGADAEKLVYETLGEIVRDGAQIVMIAGNHDSPARMDALTSILRMVGVHTVGSVPEQAEDAILSVPSRDRAETATFAALPWVPERWVLRFETLMKSPDASRTQYREVMEAEVKRSCAHFIDDTINVFVGHMLIDGSEIGEGGGERKLHIGHAFAVNASCFPSTANYVALGHVHKRQQIAAGSPTFYAGSLVQLDFGEGGQKKYVNIVDAKPRQPSDIRAIEITGGRGLRTVTVDFDALSSHGGKYGDDYLRVIVRAERPIPSLFEQVREVLPNALDVTLERSDEAPIEVASATTRGLAPHELLARYYKQRHNADAPEPIMALFNELYEAEAGHASA